MPSWLYSRSGCRKLPEQHTHSTFVPRSPLTSNNSTGLRNALSQEMDRTRNFQVQPPGDGQTNSWTTNSWTDGSFTSIWSKRSTRHLFIHIERLFAIAISGRASQG
jgi:hypothetical protein